MEAAVNVQVHVATQAEPISLQCKRKTTAEELCTRACKRLQIPPLARSLFALRVTSSSSSTPPAFLPNGAPVDSSRTAARLDLRIRHKLPSYDRLRSLDPHTYHYYFHQIRRDLLDNNVAEVVYSKHREELFGLGITDMYRAMIQDGKTIQEIMKDYKKYIPQEVMKKHSIFTKKPIYNSLFQLQKNSLTSSYVIEKFLRQMELLAPNYLSESYKASIEKENTISEVIVHVIPFHQEQPGVRVYHEKQNKWEHICTIDELCFMTLRNDFSVEISRMNGIPIYLMFTTEDDMLSFISVCDGYYRLMVKWTFNICKDVASTELINLHKMKCHGPVGGAFSYHKLEEKRSNKAGCYILRQCESQYDVFYIDLCTKYRTKPITFKIQKNQDGYIFDNKNSPSYKSIAEIINAHTDPNNEIFLNECVPPSEYDKSQLLLCEPSGMRIANNIDQNDLENILSTNKGPRCIDTKDLQLYKGSKIESSAKATYYYKARWNITQEKKIIVAMKMLRQDTGENCFKEFIEMAGEWAFLKSSSIVRLYGVTLRSPVSMIMENLPLGPLDLYLQNKNKNSIQVVDLVEAAASLATALWHLTENGIVHSNIRCRKLLVASHDSDKFTVKLADRGLHSCYKDNEIHWLPIEFYNNMELARKSPFCDVWAFATTLWEIFSYGELPTNMTKKNYISGQRLLRPKDCPKEIYKIMEPCWLSDPHSRLRPQAIMRDVNHYLYQVFNSRRMHNYSTIPSQSNTSDNAKNSWLTFDDSDSENDSKYNSSQTFLINDDDDDDTVSSNLSTPIDFMFPNKNMDRLQDIYEFEGYQVILQGIIGQGNYGYVFKGTLQKDDSSESRIVAVKKLISNTESSQVDDFDQEIRISKALKHRNIVDILGFVDKPDILLIMEFIQHGSLKCYLNIHRTEITIHQLLKYSSDVASGMEYLEKMNVVHRDLAARNILVVNEDHVKISDFGLARQVDHGGYYRLKSDRPLPLNWYAPESIRSGKFSTKSDVWSYGVTLWEMFSFGKEPPTLDQLGQENINSRLPPPANCPMDIYRDLMMTCWELKPMSRPTFTQIHTNCEKLLMDLPPD